MKLIATCLVDRLSIVILEIYDNTGFLRNCDSLRIKADEKILVGSSFLGRHQPDRERVVHISYSDLSKLFQAIQFL